MNIDQNTLDLLKKDGFLWFKDRCTDKVDPDCIKDIIPAANGFTVVYNEKAVIRYSTAIVEKIVFAPNSTQWHRVHWIGIQDERK